MAAGAGGDAAAWCIFAVVLASFKSDPTIAGLAIGGGVVYTVFMLTLGNYLTPTLLGGKNSLWFTEQIYTQFITRFNWNQGAAFGFLLLFLSSLLVWAGLKLTGQRFGAVMKT